MLLRGTDKEPLQIPSLLQCSLSLSLFGLGFAVHLSKSNLLTTLILGNPTDFLLTQHADSALNTCHPYYRGRGRHHQYRQRPRRRRTLEEKTFFESEAQESLNSAIPSILTRIHHQPSQT